MKCKFCGCTDRRACRIPLTLSGELLLAGAAAVTIANEFGEFTMCRWIAPRICSAPACVEKAYAERCAEIDRLMLVAA